MLQVWLRIWINVLWRGILPCTLYVESELRTASARVPILDYETVVDFVSESAGGLSDLSFMVFFVATFATEAAKGTVKAGKPEFDIPGSD
jgi:hypothetical protein